MQIFSGHIFKAGKILLKGLPVILALCIAFPTAVLAASEKMDRGSASEEFSAPGATEAYDVSEEFSATSDELLLEYFENELGAEQLTGADGQPASPRSNRLVEKDLILYNCVREKLTEIAAGTRAETIIEVPLSDIYADFDRWIPESEFGLTEPCYTYENGRFVRNEVAVGQALAKMNENIMVDFDTILSCLIADCPYELYWSSKHSEIAYPNCVWSYSYSGGNVDTSFKFEDNANYVIKLSAAEDYRSAFGDEYQVDTEKTSAAAIAAERAKAVVAEFAGKSDYEKLLGYKNFICGEVSYNEYAKDHAEDPEYNETNPWQLIYVFDSDPDTNVVCEGYSKAFQYLCNLTDFNGPIVCLSPTGMMSGGTGEGPHMWNIVRMKDGFNYLIDVTNCDEGSIGYEDSLFLRGFSQQLSGDDQQGYVIDVDGTPVSYQYDPETLDLYNSDELILRDCDYSYEEPETEPSFRSHSLVLSGQIGVNFFVDLSMLTPEQREDVSMKFTINGESTIVPFNSDFMNETEEYYGFTCYVTSVQMADEIMAELTYGDGKTVSEIYKVEDYIAAVDESPDLFTGNCLALVRAIADFGYYAQQFLSEVNGWTIGTEHAGMEHISDGYSEEDILVAKQAVENYNTSVEIGDAQIKKVTYSLNFESETAIRIYLTVNKDYEGDVTAQIGSDAADCTRLKDGRYCIVIKGIPAHRLGDQYSVTVSAGGTSTISLSALSYVNKALHTEDAALNNLEACNSVVSLYYYYEKAKAYSENPDG